MLVTTATSTCLLFQFLQSARHLEWTSIGNPLQRPCPHPGCPTTIPYERSALSIHLIDQCTKLRPLTTRTPSAQLMWTSSRKTTRSWMSTPLSSLNMASCQTQITVSEPMHISYLYTQTVHLWRLLHTHAASNGLFHNAAQFDLLPTKRYRTMTLKGRVHSTTLGYWLWLITAALCPTSLLH